MTQYHKDQAPDMRFGWIPRAIDTGQFSPAEAEYGPIQARIVQTAVQITALSDIPTMVEQWIREDRMEAGKRPGPTPWMPPAAITTLELILCLLRRPPQVKQMCDMLRNEFTAEAWRILGVAPPGDISDEALYARLYNSKRILKDLIDPEPGSLRTLMTKAEVTQMQSARDQADCQKRRRRALQWANGLLHGSVRLLPRNVIDGYGGNIVIDATHARAPASRGTSKRSEIASSEPEAGWYRRIGDHDGSKTSRAKTKYRRRHDALEWGREVTTLVGYAKKPGTAAEMPHIVMAMTIDNPGKRNADNAMDVVDAHLANGHRPGTIVTDRAYLPRCKPEDLALPLRKRGYRLVMDYDSTETMLGVQTGHEGGILVEGTWYCPSMPDGLKNATIDYMLRDEDDPRRISDDEFRRRIAQRERYRLRRKELPDQDGYTRRMCPAAGPSATVTCPLQEQHPKAQVKQGLTRILPANLLDPPPKVCTNQSTLTFPPVIGAKYEQEHAYKGKAWQKHYTSARQAVESVNGSLKNANFNTIGAAKRRPARGWVSQLLALAPMITATNVRKIVSWLETGPRGPVKRARRRDADAGLRAA